MERGGSPWAGESHLLSQFSPVKETIFGKKEMADQSTAVEIFMGSISLFCPSDFMVVCIFI